MKNIYDNEGNHIATVYGEQDAKDMGEGCSYLALGLVLYFCLPFLPFIVYFKGKRDRVNRQGRVSRFFSAIICFCFGINGAHKFYEGNIKKGLLYMFTCGLFGIGWLYDFFALIFRDEDFYIPNTKVEASASKKAKILTAVVFLVFCVLIAALVGVLLSMANR